MSLLCVVGAMRGGSTPQRRQVWATWRSLVDNPTVGSTSGRAITAFRPRRYRIESLQQEGGRQVGHVLQFMHICRAASLCISLPSRLHSVIPISYRRAASETNLQSNLAQKHRFLASHGCRFDAPGLCLAGRGRISGLQGRSGTH